MDNSGWSSAYHQKAEKVWEEVKKLIGSDKTESRKSRVLLFTGHSGGGAVAQVLFYFRVSRIEVVTVT